MSAKIIDCSDSKKEGERIKYLEDWVEMQFWMYEQHLKDELVYLELSDVTESSSGEKDKSTK